MATNLSTDTPPEHIRTGHCTDPVKRIIVEMMSGFA